MWDESALKGFDPSLVTSIHHCPILAATEGYSCDPMLIPTAESLLLDAQPIFLPEGELIGTKVLNGTNDFLQTYLLPEVCNFPLRLRWPTTIGFPDFFASICAAIGSKNSPPFEAVLNALKTTLEPWFTAIALDHQPFLLTGSLFFPMYDKHFPDILSGVWPDWRCLMVSLGAFGVTEFSQPPLR
jgi:hypothetical protein